MANFPPPPLHISQLFLSKLSLLYTKKEQIRRQGTKDRQRGINAVPGDMCHPALCSDKIEISRNMAAPYFLDKVRVCFVSTVSPAGGGQEALCLSGEFLEILLSILLFKEMINQESSSSSRLLSHLALDEICPFFKSKKNDKNAWGQNRVAGGLMSNTE